MYYLGEAVPHDDMGMEHHTTITVHEDTHLALKRICKVYDYNSIHQFVLQQVLKQEEQGEEKAIPVGLRIALEDKAANTDGNRQTNATYQ